MQVRQFDRDLSLGELLDPTLTKKIEAALTRSLGTGWRLVDADGTVLLGAAADAGADDALVALTLRLDIEPLGQLVSVAPRTQVEAAASWLELVLRGVQRYRMASDLHLAAVHADYEALQRKHTALQESEARYRTLSAQLEQRVAEQVQVIERAQRQLYQSEKMAAVGSLAAGMAHEINNPIGFIRSNLATARGYVQKLATVLTAYRNGDTNAADEAWDKTDLDFILEDFPGLLDESAGGADRIARIIANLKAYSSIDCDAALPVDLNDSVRTVLAMAGDQLAEGITLETELQPLPQIVCDQSRVNQMLYALVQNARQAIRGNGRIHIATGVENGEVRISVRDTGCGIAPGIISRIFDPFFTTRDVGKGMGLGLTVGRDIALSHGGRIEVVSSVDAGSTFTVCLPLATTLTSKEPDRAA